MFAQKVFKGTIQSIILGLAFATTNLMAQQTSARRLTTSARQRHIAPASNNTFKRWAKYAALAFIAYRIYRTYQAHKQGVNHPTQSFQAPRAPINTSQNRPQAHQQTSPAIAELEKSIADRQKAQAQREQQIADALQDAKTIIQKNVEVKVANKKDEIAAIARFITMLVKLAKASPAKYPFFTQHSIGNVDNLTAWVTLLYNRHFSRTEINNAYKNDKVLVARILPSLSYFDQASTDLFTNGKPQFLSLSSYPQILGVYKKLSQQETALSREEAEFLAAYNTTKTIRSFINMATAETAYTSMDANIAAFASAMGAPL